MSWLAGAVVGLAVVVVMRRLGVNAIWPYAMVGVVVWVATLESGVHATNAGVALGPLTPARDVGGRNRSEEHTSELQSLMRTSYAVFCLKQKHREHTTYLRK